MIRPTRVRIPPLSAFAAVLLSACLEVPDCGLDGCPRREYEIATLVQSPEPPYRTPIGILDTGQLQIEVRMRERPLSKISKLSKRAAAQATDCIGCQDILENSVLTFDQPILAGGDTIPAFTNLLAPEVVSKLGTGWQWGLHFHRGIRFRKGENKIAFASEFIQGSKKIGSLRLEATLEAAGPSSW